MTPDIPTTVVVITATADAEVTPAGITEED